MSRHTEGPWSHYDIYGGNYQEVFGPKTPGSDRLRVVGKSDAQLIAAAPELLAACEAFIDMWHRAGPLGSHQFEKFDGVVRMAKMAIGKARGEE